MTIELRSFNQILGNMIRTLVATTPLNDVNTGSVILSLLEACAANDFENNTAILSVLELLNIDALRNNDLDARAADFGLQRYTAIKAAGVVTIYNSNITKQSTGLYVIKPAPISGQSVLYVNNTTGWAATGTLYIGRGTTSFEGPIAYTSITTYPTYSKVILGSALQKDHLSSDTVINAQGQVDRVIAAGTVVQIPANSQNPEIKYTTLRNAILPAGEDHVDSVSVIARVPGSQGNALINTITQFESPPFSGATVSNTSSFSNGTDIETDTQLRNRLKTYTTTLARGTAPAIIAAVVGTSDLTDNKQVVSAVLTEPTTVGEPSILYVDDGKGFQPSYAGQSVDILLANATGKEQFLQLANFPLPRAQVVNSAIGPFALTESMFLRVAVDGVEDTVTFTSSDFINITAATVTEMVIAINAQSTLFKARLTNTSQNILLYPVAWDAETIQVIPLKSTDNSLLYANTVFKFPVDVSSYISLYQNSAKLTQKQKTATIETVPFAAWNISGPGSLNIMVDGTPAQNVAFSLGDFVGASSWATLSLNDWVAAFNGKIAGITAIATPSQTMKISSNKTGSGSSVAVSGGTYLNKLFSATGRSAVGQSSQFDINRETGNIKTLTTINKGDTITAGIVDAKGFVVSSASPSGIFNVASDGVGRPAEMIVVVDSKFCNIVPIVLQAGVLIDVTVPSASRMRLTVNTTGAFTAVMPGHYIYIAPRTGSWLNANNSGLFKVVAKGPHLSVGVDTYIDVLNNSTVPQAGIAVVDVTDIRGFSTDGYPQVWRGIYTANPPAATLSDIVNSLNTSLLGIQAAIYRSNSIRATSTTESGGSIAIPISSGNASSLFTTTTTAQLGNPPPITNRVSDKALFGAFERAPGSSATAWLNRNVFTPVSGDLSATANPDVPPFSATYSETIQATGVLTLTNVNSSDLVAFTRGDNQGLIRSIAAKIVTDSVGTQQDTPRTELDHVIGDQVMLLQSLKFAGDDSIVFVLDKDPSAKTVDIKMARNGRVNAGSGGSFTPTSTEFSADDIDNEAGITFSDLNVWGITTNHTNFADYAVLMRARNWYSTGGVAGGSGKMIVRAADYGSSGNGLHFNIQYPANPNAANATTILQNAPLSSTLSYFFGSGPDRTTLIPNGTTIAVKGPYPDVSTNFPNGTISTGLYFDYTFSAGSFGSVIANDVLSILSTSGVSAFNRGAFGIKAISGNTVRVFNPGASVTSPGAPTVSTVTTVADVIGTPTSVTLSLNFTSAIALDGTYFTMYDNAGSIKVWFDVNNDGTAEPVSGPTNRKIKIATIATGDTSTQVATKIAQYLSNDIAFTSVFSTATQVLYTLAQNGAIATPTDGTAPTGFSWVNTPGTADVSLSGKYFTIYDDVGSVAVWFDVGNQGILEPLHGAARSIRISNLSKGASANTVAATTAAAIALDAKFLASPSTNQITITTTFNAAVTSTSAGTSGFSVSTAPGSLPADELIVNAGQLHIFPLTKTAVSDIVIAINSSKVMTAAAVGNAALTIVVSTTEEQYTYGGNSTALGFGHNPTSSTLRGFVGMYDGINWVKNFANSNPNFTLKDALSLNGVAPSVYVMSTAPNEDSTTGENVKLVPTTVRNVQHHFTQKALSQLPIIANVTIADSGKNVQITSYNLGSSGAIEVVGGQANKAIASILGEAETVIDITGRYLTVRTAAFPNTFSAGDIVKMQNPSGVQRLSRLATSDTMQVVALPLLGAAQYQFKPKAINVSSSTTFKIEDKSSLYSRPAGYVWRWTHDGSATLTDVVAGDLVLAHGSPDKTSAMSGWSQGNMAGLASSSTVTGLPIINVNDSANWFDVVNPHGVAMTVTAVGVTGTVQICPTQTIPWRLSHISNIKISSLTHIAGTVTVTCADSHFLNTGDKVVIQDSTMLTDGTYPSGVDTITVISATQFTFPLAGSDPAENNSNASLIKAGKVSTRYRVEPVGVNGLTRLVHQDGEAPRFIDCGVAVDDYMIISGSTFDPNNNGIFRVVAADNNSVLFMNESAVEEVNTIRPFNNSGLTVSWTANSNQVTGAAGSFKNLNLGDWVKKSSDKDSVYLQVVGFNPSTPALATAITLGFSYSGTTADDTGVAYNQLVDAGQGVYLQNAGDVAFLEGDSALAGDKLLIQNIVNNNWFNIRNTGTFDISQVGTDPVTYTPMLTVVSASAIDQTTVQLLVNPDAVHVVEGTLNKLVTYRKIEGACLDSIDSARRILYLSPADRQPKFSEANGTTIISMSKLGYNTDVTIGVDGYLYYTGLLQRVQRIVDGFEPDPTNFPGRRAIGGRIETLPPLVKDLAITLTVTTGEGFNVGDVSNNIKSAVINYVESLGVGQDVILSEIIAKVMQIKGIVAVTFNNPVPSTERITIAGNEKATISPNNIGIA